MPDVDFDALSDASRRSGGSRESMDALWGATYELETWYFIGRGSLPDLAPYCAVVEGRPMVYAFTDDSKCDVVARKIGLVDDKGCTQFIATDPGSLIDWIPWLQQNGVWGLMFNPGPHNYFAPLTNLIPMRDYFSEMRRAG